MKRRSLDPQTPVDSAETNLCKALLEMRNVAEMRALLHDLCTPAELEALIDRWTVVPHVLKGTSYREIHEQTAVSITTIGRVAGFLSRGHGGYRNAAARVAIGARRGAGNGKAEVPDAARGSDATVPG